MPLLHHIDSAAWIDDEAELLLNVTLKYKTTKVFEGFDWEGIRSKYAGILERFRDPIGSVFTVYIILFSKRFQTYPQLETFSRIRKICSGYTKIFNTLMHNFTFSCNILWRNRWK